jgi:hypothetical protein
MIDHSPLLEWTAHLLASLRDPLLIPPHPLLLLRSPRHLPSRAQYLDLLILCLQLNLLTTNACYEEIRLPLLHDHPH